MCFGYILGTFLCFVYKWMKLGFDLVNDYEEEPEKPIYTQQHFEFIKKIRKEESLFDKVNNVVKNEKLFIVDNEGKRKSIKLSYTADDNLIFKITPPEPPRQEPRIIKEGEQPKRNVSDRNTSFL